MNSILKNVVYLKLITTGQNLNTSEIIEISAIKVTDNKLYKLNTLVKPYEKVSASIFGNCKNLKQDELDKAPTIYQVRKKVLEFIEDYPVIIHNMKSEKEFLDKYVFTEKVKNTFLDSKELAMVLEPYHKEYSLDYLLKNITKTNKTIINRAYNDCISNIYVVNSLLIRLFKSEESRLDKLYFNLEQYFINSNITKWEWIPYIKEDDDIKEYKKYTRYQDEISDIGINKHRLNLTEYKNNYEELLKKSELWTSSKDFSYTFRPRQYDFTRFINEVFNSKHDTPKIGCIEAPTGIGKSVGYLIPAIIESLYNHKKIVISTDTKNLQMQLINKDIPNVLKSMNLLDEINYGCMKGKTNYLCKRRLEEYTKDIVFKSKKELLSIIFIIRLIQEGKYGDIEEISQDIYDIFEDIEILIYSLRCESDICYPDKCFEKCFYKSRIKELPKEHITVINHSLLAKWPYKEKKSLDYLIVDEAHNLMEKSYDFFTSECSSILLDRLLNDLYPHNDVNHKNISMMDKFYISISAKIELDSNVRKKLQNSITLIKESLSNILQKLDKNLKPDMYDHTWEINRQDAPLNYIAIKNKIDINSFIRFELENMVLNIKEISKVLNFIIDQCEKEEENDSYLFNTINARTKDIEDIIMTIENFIHQVEDGFCRIIDVDSEYKYFNIKVVPIDVSEMFESMFLSTVNTVVFLSATLNISGNMKNFKSTLGLDKHRFMEKTIESIYDYDGKTKIFGLENFPTYNALNDEFIHQTASLIEEICLNSNSHVLALFTSKNRLDKVYDELLLKLNNHNIELYKDKHAVNNLRDLTKKCVVLASKSCFEGVDIPGEGLTCVILDKLPNRSLDDPLYSSIRSYKRRTYDEVNYPQLSIKAKQVYGRLIRSKYDYGYFIILDPGKNNQTISKLQRDLHECDIKRVDRDYIIDNIIDDFKNWKMRTFKEILKDIKCNIFSDKDIITRKGREIKKIDYINEEISNRNINMFIKDIDSKNRKLKIAYK